MHSDFTNAITCCFFWGSWKLLQLSDVKWSKRKPFFFKTKTGTKQGLIVFRWVLPDGGQCYFFNQTLAVLQEAAASLHCLTAQLRRSDTTRAEILENDTSTSMSGTTHTFTPTVHFQSLILLLLEGNVYVQSFCSSTTVIVWCLMHSKAFSCWFVIAGFPASFPLF